MFPRYVINVSYQGGLDIYSSRWHPYRCEEHLGVLTNPWKDEEYGCRKKVLLLCDSERTLHVRRQAGQPLIPVECQKGVNILTWCTRNIYSIDNDRVHPDRAFELVHPDDLDFMVRVNNTPMIVDREMWSSVPLFLMAQEDMRVDVLAVTPTKQPLTLLQSALWQHVRNDAEKLFDLDTFRDLEIPQGVKKVKWIEIRTSIIWDAPAPGQ